MIICHSRRFIYFSNPFCGSDRVRALLDPWNEEPVVAFEQRIPERPFYTHMSPTEAEWTFDALGLKFNDYDRITNLRSPFDRLPEVYEAVERSDPIWRMRKRSGVGVPTFENWLARTRPNGRGAGGRAHQRWRRFGTWSAEDWCAGRITRVLRCHRMNQDLGALFADLGIAPSKPIPPGCDACTDKGQELLTPRAVAMISERYATEISEYGYQVPDLNIAA
ncbi:hypothetical protein EU803_10450 [Loktanella sp. IMCC34160]|uniref:hypothetical protein n=1 Tax=Loktanella sp. IMCC34160 TaxID=2510646 RepID=UPI00101B97A5|nr:hypothetical protein [Loktanella sp. IMCC34160]RYG91502.1 hypothetical protein EU803_10450 [Loktanella sp. IMCC34160]